jgi:hypothetical protein
LLATFLLVSSPALPAAFTGSGANIVYVMETPMSPRRRRRRNHYSGKDF